MLYYLNIAMNKNVAIIYNLEKEGIPFVLICYTCS